MMHLQNFMNRMEMDCNDLCPEKNRDLLEILSDATYLQP